MALLGKVAKAEEGQSVVELSLVVPIAIVLVLGIVQILLLATTKSALVNGAFEAARAAAFIVESDPQGAKSAAERVLEKRLQFLPIAPGFLSGKPSVTSLEKSGDEVELTAVVDQMPLPLLQQLYGLWSDSVAIRLSATATAHAEPATGGG